jgi:ubiquinone/menaquinone biosynthesis C-methylase UbiE
LTSQANFFDSRAEEWEKKCYPGPVRERLERLIPEFGIKRGAQVLDIGTGPGILLPYLQPSIGSTGTICAFDISEKMVQEARKKALTSAVLTLRADVHRIPFCDEVFDHIICFAAFPHFADPVMALREMARVAKSGSVIVIAHLMSRAELAEHHGKHHSVADDILPNPSNMVKLFLDAGISVPEITDIPGRYLAKGMKRTKAW